MPLSDTQTLILTAATQHPDSIATPPASLQPASRAAVAKSMLRAELLAATESKHDDRGTTWKLDGGMVVLRITKAGLRAIGVEQHGMPAPLVDAVPEVADAIAAAPATDAATTMPANHHSESRGGSGAECVVGAGQPAEAAQGASQASHGAPPAARLRDAARAVLAAWDTPDRPDLAAALEVLRTALPMRTAAPPRTASRLPRPNTKQAQVLALLRRPEGASGPALIEATGWHRTRSAASSPAWHGRASP